MAKKYQLGLDAKTMIKDQSLLRHEDIKQHILVLPELADYIPPLLPEEFKQLEENIIQNGCREALLVWETTSDRLPDLETTDTAYILIDGHNRYAICKKHHVDFKVHLMNFPSLEQVKFFMIDNQLGRRNLAPEQVSYLRGLRYLREKQEKGKYNREEQKGQNVPFEDEDAVHKQDQSKSEAITKVQNTAQKLGKQFNVSEKTIKRDGIYAQGLEKLAPVFRQDILSGRTKVDKALIQQITLLDDLPEPIQNQTELLTVIQQAQEKLKPQPVNKSRRSVSNEKMNQLKQQLAQLVSRLNAKKVNVNQVCNQIIECARQMQQQ
ncbi:ParB N-terminal domain-containing protein [Spirosoma pulveris]